MPKTSGDVVTDGLRPRAVKSNESTTDVGPPQSSAVPSTPPIDKIEVGKQPASVTPLTSLRECYEQWKTPSFTELQKKRFEKDHLGKSVDWNVWVDSVTPSSHARISVAIRDQGERFDLPRAIVAFPATRENDLLALKEGDVVNVRGTLADFFLWPSVEGAEISKLEQTRA
jgi:hypothetical protein